jgi:Glycosyltransferase family 10 (fucosyltransferase) C-term
MRCIVIDIEIPQFLGNRILDEDYMARWGSSVVSPWICFGRFVREQGWDVLTADVFLAERPAFQQAVSVSNEFTPFLPELIALGVKPGVLISGESPAVARRFYKDLPLCSGPFRHAYLFRGCLSRLARGVEGHPFLWPCPAHVLATDRPWSERQLLGLVAGFKGVWSGPRTWLRRLPASLRWHWDQLRQPSLRLRDLYRRRFKLIRKFGPKPDFVLRGAGWENTVNGKCRWYRKPVQYANFPSPCDHNHKLSVLGECRFALAMENAIYPGYVTEKIFDVFRAGAVPVYLGAPDITDFVPADCFVDYRDFASLNMLWRALEAITEARWVQYREAGRAFMSSVQYQRHLEQNIARQWLSWLEDVLR